MDLEGTYNKIAKIWMEDRRPHTSWHSAADRFIELLAPGNRVLDVGCGHGLTSRYLADNGMLVTGIDFSEEMIALAKQEAPDSVFLKMDIERVWTTSTGRFMECTRKQCYSTFANEIYLIPCVSSKVNLSMVA